jgi:hypothetical protein
MQTTLEPSIATGFTPEPISSRIFVRCYGRYTDAKRAYDQLRVVAGIPDKRMTVVARGLEWREALPVETLYRVACSLATLSGAVVGLALWALGFAAADIDGLTQTIFAALAGLIVGFIVATATAWLRQARPGMAGTGHVEPRQYDILVEEDLAPVAREVLAAD